MAINRIAGVINFKVDGRQFAARGKFKSSIVATKREGIAGQDTVHGYKEMPVVPVIEGELSYLQDTSIEEIHAIEDATIVLELANGAVHILRNAWFADAMEVDTEEGSFGVKFEGLSGDEIRAAA